MAIFYAQYLRAWKMAFHRTIDHKVVWGPCKQVSGTPATSCTMSINPTLANEVETLLMNFTAVYLILKKDPWKPSHRLIINLQSISQLELRCQDLQQQKKY
jgi:hypothetical protein